MPIAREFRTIRRGGRNIPSGRTELRLLNANAGLFVQDQTVEDRQHLFPVGIYTLQVFPEAGLEIRGLHPLIDHRAGYIDILPQTIDIVATEKQAVEERRLSLG